VVAASTTSSDSISLPKVFEAEALVVAATRAEVEQVHADIQVLAGARAELVSRLQVTRDHLTRK
jgi:hypothetical protein